MCENMGEHLGLWDRQTTGSRRKPHSGNA